MTKDLLKDLYKDFKRLNRKNLIWLIFIVLFFIVMMKGINALLLYLGSDEIFPDWLMFVGALVMIVLFGLLLISMKRGKGK